MPQGLKIVCSIILQGSRLRRTGRTPNDTDAVKGLHTIFETGLKVFALDMRAFTNQMYQMWIRFQSRI